MVLLTNGAQSLSTRWSNTRASSWSSRRSTRTRSASTSRLYLWFHYLAINCKRRSAWGASKESKRRNLKSVTQGGCSSACRNSQCCRTQWTSKRKSSRTISPRWTRGRWRTTQRRRGSTRCLIRTKAWKWRRSLKPKTWNAVNLIRRSGWTTRSSWEAMWCRELEWRNWTWYNRPSSRRNHR